MESYGATLRSKREEKKLTINTVARETTIAEHFIEALENEEPHIFPSSTYASGFLRNYSDYLGLDSTHMLKIYNARALQETPTPVELMICKRSYTKLIVLIIGLILVLGIGGSILWYHLIYKENNKNETLVDLTNTPQTYELSSVPFQKRVYEGDTLSLTIEGTTVNLEILETRDALIFDSPVGTQFVELSEELAIDVDGENGTDLVVFLSDISNTDASRGAEIRAFLTTATTQEPTNQTVFLETEADIAQASDLPTGFAHTEIIAGRDALPFTINATFRDVCLLRYKSDFKDSVENLFIPGDNLIIQANNSVRLWVSNYNVVAMDLIADGKTYKIETGIPGEVAVQDVRWIKEADREYKLVVTDIE